MNDTLREATRWLENRVSPIPVGYKSKMPLIPWHDWVDELPPVKYLEHWFKNPRTNLGVIGGGQTNLVIIDFDNMEYYYGWRRDILRTRSDEWRDVVLRTYRVLTARGLHLYIHTTKPETSYKVRDHGLDIRSSGNYTLVPPSVHPTGYHYRPVGSPNQIVTVSNLKEVIVGDFVNITPQAPSAVDWFADVERVDINLIKSRFDILEFVSRYRSVRRSPDGIHYHSRCINPSHRDRNPSFMINRQTQKAWCMSGRCELCAPPTHDVIDLYAIVHQVSLGQAIQEMAQ